MAFNKNYCNCDNEGQTFYVNESNHHNKCGKPVQNIKLIPNIPKWCDHIQYDPNIGDYAINYGSNVLMSVPTNYKYCQYCASARPQIAL